MLIVSLLVTIPIVEKMAAIFVSDSEVYPSLDLDRASWYIVSRYKIVCVFFLCVSNPMADYHKYSVDFS